MIRNQVNVLACIILIFFRLQCVINTMREIGFVKLYICYQKLYDIFASLLLLYCEKSYRSITLTSFFQQIRV